MRGDSLITRPKTERSEEEVWTSDNQVVWTARGHLTGERRRSSGSCALGVRVSVVRVELVDVGHPESQEAQMLSRCQPCGYVNLYRIARQGGVGSRIPLLEMKLVAPSVARRRRCGRHRGPQMPSESRGVRHSGQRGRRQTGAAGKL